MAALEFSRRYSMAHRLLADPASKCAVPHGHNEIVTVRLEPAQPFIFGGANAIAPFSAIKGRWHRWIDEAVDHCFMVGEDDPIIAFFREREPAQLKRLMTFRGDPTTEALAACFWLKLSAFLVEDALPFRVTGVRVEETPTNTVAIHAGVFDPETCGMPARAWPRRADMSINEFDR
ncbi:MAG: 6-carboxytetrahydropterin synthase [Hyphomonadaceae bacterium]|nr:6-carboxytetrahydropterin synthase [Hyphomonadaceae bacterium]